jgi:hypothetical protein
MKALTQTVEPDEATISALGRDWTQDGRPRSIAARVVYYRAKEELGAMGIRLTPDMIAPKPEDVQAEETEEVCRRRLFAEAHADTASPREAWIEERVSAETLLRPWRSRR